MLLALWLYCLHFPMMPSSLWCGAERVEDVDLLIRRAERCLEAGADMIMIDADDICQRADSLRADIVAKIVGRLGLEKTMFEASNPNTSEWFVRRYGPRVNESSILPWDPEAVHNAMLTDHFASKKLRLVHEAFPGVSNVLRCECRWICSWITPTWWTWSVSEASTCVEPATLPYSESARPSSWCDDLPESSWCIRPSWIVPVLSRMECCVRGVEMPSCNNWIWMMCSMKKMYSCLLAVSAHVSYVLFILYSCPETYYSLSQFIGCSFTRKK